MVSLSFPFNTTQIRGPNKNTDMEGAQVAPSREPEGPHPVARLACSCRELLQTLRDRHAPSRRAPRALAGGCRVAEMKGQTWKVPEGSGGFQGVPEETSLFVPFLVGEVFLVPRQEVMGSRAAAFRRVPEGSRGFRGCWGYLLFFNGLGLLCVCFEGKPTGNQALGCLCCTAATLA